jgi:hypothetical protein
MVSSTRRTAGCGPACPVVWQGRVGDHFPYADSDLTLLWTDFWLTITSPLSWTKTQRDEVPRPQLSRHAKKGLAEFFSVHNGAATRHSPFELHTRRPLFSSNRRQSFQ